MSGRRQSRVTVAGLAALVEQGFEDQKERMDRFERQVLKGLDQRPTREEVQAVAKATAAEAANEVLRHGGKGNGNGSGGSEWWRDWRKVGTVLLTLGWVVGAALAGFLQALQNGLTLP